FETLSFVAHCDFERDPHARGHALHLLEFWDDFSVLLAADTLGGVYFYAATPLLHCNTGQLLHSFANDRDRAGSSGGTSARPTTVAEGDDDEPNDEPDELGERADKAFLTETIEFAARKLLRFRRRGAAVASSPDTSATAPTPEADPTTPECAVTAMRVVADEPNARFLLVTGDERGVVRVWDLSGMVARLSLSRIPEIKCRYLRRGYHPKAMFSRDYLKDATSEEAQRAGSRTRHHAGVLLSQEDWRAALLAGDDLDPHFQLSQVDLKRLSRRRLEAKKKLTALTPATAKLPSAAARAASATAAFAAAAAFLGGQAKGGSEADKSSSPGSTAKQRSFMGFRPTASDASASWRRHSARGSPSDVRLLHVWQAHADGITSVEVTRDPDILVTCALDMRVFVWSWQGTCLGKLFDAENVGRWAWRFAKDDARRCAERAQVVDGLLHDLELTPLEKARKRRQTLYEEHTARKSFKDMQRVNTILLDHIISKNLELDVLSKSAAPGEEQQQREEDESASARHRGGGVEASEPLSATHRLHIDAPHSQDAQARQPLPTEPSNQSRLRLHSLAQVGPLLCVNRSEYRSQARTAGGATFVEQDDLKMDKKYLEQELAISAPASLNTASIAAGAAVATGNSSTLGDVQSQVAAAHLAAKATLESRAALARKAADMYANMEQLKQRTSQPCTSEQRATPSGADLDTLLAPSAFLQQRLPAADLALRPRTAPVKHARWLQQQQQPRLERLSVANQFRPGDTRLQGSSSAPLLLAPRRQSVTLDRRKSSLDIGFVDEACDAPERGDDSNGDNDNVAAVGSLQKLRTINQILSRAQEFCSPANESAARATTAPSPVLRVGGGGVRSPSRSPSDSDEDPSERDDTFESASPSSGAGDAAAAADTVVRAHLEETKHRMLRAMRDGERSPHRRDLRQLRRSAREQQRARRMDDYLQQKRRELTTNIGNVFKRTSFAFQSKASDDTAGAAATAAAATSKPRAGKAEAGRGATVFGIYSVREVMAVIRLFWSMDEDGSGSISLDELLQYKHFFEKLGYNDMATVFQAIDKDGNGRVSLKELLETCFHYATKYQVEEMLKLAKVGNVRSFLHGGDADGGGAGGGGAGGGGDGGSAAALTPENRRELLEIFRVFDKNGDGGVSFQELMEALRVDDDDAIAAVMAEQAARRPLSAHATAATTATDATPSGITKEDVERLYRDFDVDRNAALDFDEFVVLMRTLYAPKSNVYYFR
ncbi:hypothetical protein PybrP1_003829, partial [[Pythium] brassicae (nom. inval.)]